MKEFIVQVKQDTFATGAKVAITATEFAIEHGCLTFYARPEYGSPASIYAIRSFAPGTWFQVWEDGKA